MHLLVIEGLRDIKITLELLIKFLLSGDMKYQSMIKNLVLSCEKSTLTTL